MWYQPDCLVIGWADRFKICKIIRRFGSIASSSTTGFKASASTVASSIASTVLSSGAGLAGSFVTTSDKKDFGTHVEITCMVQTDFYICGLANFSNLKSQTGEQFLILCYEKDTVSNSIQQNIT